MWNIILVEDEPYVRRSIRQAINWEAFGFTVAAEANDGEEALAYMDANPVDLVISDIIMPYMDGIELLKTARERGHDAAFVMLTCVNEFEHARQAIQHGASGYILKLSMDEEELITILKNIRRTLEKKRVQQGTVHLQLLCEIYWRKLHGKEQENDEADAGIQVYPLGNLPPFLQLFGIRSCEAAVWRERIVSCYERQDGLLAYAHKIHNFTTVFVWSFEAYRPNLTSLDGGSPLVHTPILEGSQLPEGWQTVLMKWNEMWYAGGGLHRNQLVCPGPLTMGYRLVQGVTWKEEREILQRFDAKQLKDCELSIRAIWESMREHKMPFVIVQEFADRLDKLFARISGKMLSGTAATSLTKAKTHDELLQTLIARMALYAKQSIQHAAETDHPEVNKIIEYVAMHYDKDVTLGGMAKYVNMDEQYLSGLFKKKTGELFIQYVQRIRVEQAQFYLRETDLLVGEICDRVGFSNLNYFLKIFKKWSGQTPSEYRNAKSNSEICSPK